MMATVGIGEVLSCGVLGIFLLLVLNQYKDVIFPKRFVFTKKDRY
jgi:hypothetical protein